MKKIQVVDTNVFMHNPLALDALTQRGDVVIPLKVLEELDRNKKRDGNVGANTRRFIRVLEDIRSRGNLHDGVSLGPKRGKVRVELRQAPIDYMAGPALDPKLPDNQIIAAVRYVQASSPGKTVVFLTNDINLRVKCDVLGIQTENYDDAEAISNISELYMGSSEIKLADERIEEFFENQERFILTEDEAEGLYLNEYLTLLSETDSKKSALARFVGPGEPLAKLLVSKSDNFWGLSARNREQMFSLDAILNPKISLVTLSGRAGTGKAQPLYSNVLTPSGWREIGDLVPGDSVVTPTGVAASVESIHPQGVIPIYEITFSDGTKTRCSLDHLWAVKTKEWMKDYEDDIDLDASDYRVMPLKDIMKDLDKKYFVPSLEEIDIRKNGDKTRIHPYEVGRSMLRPIWFGKDYEPFKIAEEYRFASFENRLAFFRGVLETSDVGYEGPYFEILMPNTLIAEGVREIILSLGGVAWVKEDFEVYLRGALPPSLDTFTPTDKREEVNSFMRRAINRDVFNKTFKEVKYVGDEEAVCIYIDDKDHLYITDDYIVTHNTLIALAGALAETLDNSHYERVHVIRPVVMVGKDVGFLPGMLTEKLAPLTAPIVDNLNYLFGKDTNTLEGYIERGVINVEAMPYIRGRSLSKAIFIVDEAQNLTPHEVKTIITRAGEGTKIVFTGDIYQIDTPYLDSQSNGLSYLIDKIKSHSLYSHVQLEKGERSELANLANEML